MHTRPARSHPVLLFLLFWIPVSLFIAGSVFAAHQWFHHRPKQAILETREVDGLSRHATLLRNTLREVVSDLEILTALEANSRSGDRLVISPQLTAAYLAFSTHKNLYDQIRILDENGMERLRINQDENGTPPYVVAEERLQNKSGRYYVLETLDLPAGARFMSPLDLNVENGRIQRPHKPMLRFGQPILASNGSPIGMVLLNFRAKVLLDHLSRMAGTNPGTLMLLNEDGFWLKGPTPSMEWGFMFPSRAKRRFSSMYNAEWSRISSRSEGQFKTPSGLFTFTTLRPNQPGLHHLKGTGSVIGRNLLSPARSRAWKLVSRITPATLAEGSKEFLQNALTIAGFALLLFTFGVWLLTRSLVRRQRAEDALLHAHDALEQKVADRTEALCQSNQELNRKIRELEHSRSETEQAQSQLRLAQKMEAMGRLAGGIAHDFNNILTAILWQSEQMLRDARDHGDTDSGIQIIHDAALRARDLVRRILSFSRSEEGVHLSPIQLQPIIEETLKLLTPSLPPAITLDSDIDPACRPVLGNTTQIHQVVTNLVTNATHAMERKGGRLSVVLHDSGSHAILTVADTGTGIPREVQDRIFDPYFTTKEVGKGTGIGLSMVHAIVRQHEGDIRVESQPGQGCTVTIRIPCATSDASEEEQGAGEALPGGCERILLVDDEPDILRLVGGFLRQLGYKVDRFDSSAEALAAFRQSPAVFDLLLTDRVMPGITGHDLALRIARLRPDLPILLMTGHIRPEERKLELQAPICGLLVKPMDSGDLARTIRDCLDRPLVLTT